MKKLLLSIVLGVVTGVSMLGSNLVEDTKPKKQPRPVYILRLGEDRTIKTKIVGTLRHSMVYSGSTLDSNFTVFIPIIPGNNGLDFDKVEVEIRPKVVKDKKESVRVVRFDK